MMAVVIALGSPVSCDADKAERNCNLLLCFGLQTLSAAEQCMCSCENQPQPLAA